jgi:hypothetical protein
MGGVTQILGAANIGMGVYQSYQQSKEDRRWAELTASNLEAQAARKELEADEALKIGELKVEEHGAKSRQDIAGKRAEYASSGVKVDSGSTVDVVADKAAWSEYERQKIEYEANLQSWGLNYDAALLRQDAGNTRAAGVNSNFNWGGTLMQAGSSLLKLGK